VFRDKNILVTGGAGSVGRMIVRELLKRDPKVIRILDIDETRESFIQNKLKQYNNIRFLIGDIRDKDRLLRAMEDIDIVFHTASYKHVLSCEYNPFEAIKTNVIGTQNLIDAAIAANVEKFVFTSSDKAVNPTNVMGTTKLLSEKLVTAANSYKGPKKTVFFSVRFGNVLGSRGSVVHLFKEQIQKNQAITITDPQMTRFVMSLSQAINLLFKSMKLAQGGEVFIFKMPSVKLIDLCEVMIECTPCLLDDKAALATTKIIGKKPGEKLYEELLTQSEAAHSLETNDMYIVLPEISENSADASLYPKAKPAKLAICTSNDEHLLSKEEIKQLLYDCKVLEKANN
jgi:FlaA1/EpsC-like NDP-sugar epimerase